MRLRALTPGVLLIAALAGCDNLGAPDQQTAITVIRQLGGRMEPDKPTLTQPVWRVSLSDTGATDEHLRYLRAFPALRLLSLSNTQVTDRGLSHLKNARVLRRMNLTGTQVTNAGIEDLRRQLPALQVLR